MRGARLAGQTLAIRAAIALSALALLLRILVPVGFMPSTSGGYAISLCSDMSGMTAWVDQDGKLHKGGKPSDETTKHEPCVFSGFAASLALPDMIGPTALAPVATTAFFGSFLREFAVGRGLAAPPPPPTGPPAHS